MFPLSAWLPDSYPTAPAPVTAVFAGLLTKVGVYAIVRTQTLLFPDDSLRPLLLTMAILTMVVGILGAVAQTDIKRILSFTLVSHIGYMLLGVALGSELALSGAVYYIAHHITVQTALFLLAGLVEYRTGTTNLDRLGGLARSAPILAVAFFVPAMNLAGIPPFSGFSRQGRARTGWHRGGRLAGRHGRRGQRRGEPPDAVRHREGLEPRLLAAGRRRPRAVGGRRRLRRVVARRPARRWRRVHPHAADVVVGARRRGAAAAARHGRCRPSASWSPRSRSPCSPVRCSGSPTPRPTSCSSARHTCRPSWAATDDAALADRRRSDRDLVAAVGRDHADAGRGRRAHVGARADAVPVPAGAVALDAAPLADP
ncbi:MAG: proton-conducting transporter membrane subunit [Aeromicrobium erythreum]